MAKANKFKVENFTYRPDTFGTIRALGIDKYPGEMPIVRELIQNADDAEAHLIRLKINSDEIIVENNGKPFTKPNEVPIEKSDFFRISHIGLGKTEEEMTGTFGVGFTSVFHITDAPRIVSNGWDFEIRADNTPSIKEVPFNKITRIHLPLRLSETDLSRKIRAESFDATKLERFEKELLSEAYRDIFFLRTTNKIEAYKKGVKMFTVCKRVRKTDIITKDLTRQDVTIYITRAINGQERKSSEGWIIYYRDGINFRPDLEGLGQTHKQKVAIAIPLNSKSTRISRTLEAVNYAYHILPVTSTGFNFKYNASKFFTTSGRSEFIIKEGLRRDWNLWQMDNLAQLLALLIEDLISRKVNPKVIYKFVPISSQVRDQMDERFFNSFRSKVELKEIRLFYTSQRVWKEKTNIYMNWNGLSEVLPEESGRYLIHSKLLEHASVFEDYGISEIGPEYFVSYLESKYGTAAYESTKSEDPNQIRRIFEYLGKETIAPNLIEKLRKICILLTEENILRSYEFKVYFPTDEEMPLVNKGDIIHRQTCNTRAAKRFLQSKLKLKKINLHDLIVGSFLPRVGHYGPGQKFEFLWYLVRRQREVTRKRNVVEELRRRLREVILVEKFNDPNGLIFFADAEIKEIFRDRLNYISPRYEEQGKKEHLKWRGFLKKIGVEVTPTIDDALAVAQEIESGGYTKENTRRAALLIRLLDNYWKDFYSKHFENLKKIRQYSWIPTDKRSLALPNETYVNEKLAKLVGESQKFLAVKAPKNKGLMSVLGLLTEARLQDVVNFILEKRGEEKGERDKPVTFRVYALLNRKADNLDVDLVKALSENRTIWFKARLWKPRELFVGDFRKGFGPNGWLRGYLEKHKLSKLNSLCTILGINRQPKMPDDYLDLLADLADRLDNKILMDWQIKLIHNTYSKLAQLASIITDEQLEELKRKKIMLNTELTLEFPSHCYLLRKGEEVIYERIVKAGISVPIVEAKDAELEKLYSRLGVNEIIFSLSAKRTDENEAISDEELTKKFHCMLPWLDGFEYSLTGGLSEHNLIFQRLKVYRVKKLRVICSLSGEGLMHVGSPIEDLCCLERNQDAETLYLDQNFQIRNNEHLQLLSINLVRNLNPSIDKVRWTLAILPLLFFGKIIGISPYDRKSQEPKEAAELGPLEWEVGALTQVSRVAKVLKSREEPVIIHEPTSKETTNRLIDEVSQAIEEDSLGRTIDASKMVREKKDIPAIKTAPSVTLKMEAKWTAPKNWKPIIIDGEKVYVEEGMVLPAVGKIKELRKLTSNIVEAMGFDPEIVNICVAPVLTDGYNEGGQLFFNAVRDDSKFRWFGVVARELAYNYSRQHYPHVKAMIYLITKGLENLDKIFPAT